MPENNRKYHGVVEQQARKFASNKAKRDQLPSSDDKERPVNNRRRIFAVAVLGIIMMVSGAVGALKTGEGSSDFARSRARVVEALDSNVALDIDLKDIITFLLSLEDEGLPPEIQAFEFKATVSSYKAPSWDRPGQILMVARLTTSGEPEVSVRSSLNESYEIPIEASFTGIAGLLHHAPGKIDVLSLKATTREWSLKRSELNSAEAIKLELGVLQLYCRRAMEIKLNRFAAYEKELTRTAVCNSKPRREQMDLDESLILAETYEMKSRMGSLTYAHYSIKGQGHSHGEGEVLASARKFVSFLSPKD